jgi:hypothetical protein
MKEISKIKNKNMLVERRRKSSSRFFNQGR